MRVAGAWVSDQSVVERVVGGDVSRKDLGATRLVLRRPAGLFRRHDNASVRALLVIIGYSKRVGLYILVVSGLLCSGCLSSRNKVGRLLVFLVSSFSCQH